MRRPSAESWFIFDTMLARKSNRPWQEELDATLCEANGRPWPDAENAYGGEVSLASFSFVARLGQQFVIDNRPGGGGNIGTEAGTLPDKLILNGHGRSSISNGALDAHHDADHRSRLCPAGSGKCAPAAPSQSSAAKQSPRRATHRPAIPRSAPPSSAGSITATARRAVLLE